MHRFFIPASNIAGNLVNLDSKTLEHIKVLRLRQGELFTVCDGEGFEYSCRFNGRNSNIADILEQNPASGEPNVDVTVFMAFSKGERSEYAIQKSVELGAKEIVLFPSARCVSRPDDASLSKKQTRWQTIALEAAQQSGRGIVPQIRIHTAFDAAVAEAMRSELPLFLYEDEQQLGLKEALETHSPINSISIFSGPEGGFEPAEAAFVRESGLLSVSLGPRILRCETAPAAALAAIMFFTGNM